jgi:hypothetical protein
MRRQHIVSEFNSIKTIKPIPIDSPATRMALLHLTLDPAVIAIDYFEEIPSPEGFISARCIFVRDGRGRHLLDIWSNPPAEKVIDIVRELEIPLWTISKETLTEEPQSTNESNVWKHRGHLIPVHFRMQVAAKLRRKPALPMNELETAIVGFKSVREPILALACASLVWIDLKTTALGPSSTVHRGNW